ncbi:MAG: phosphatidylglycerophosphatase A [Firmicutes bacterium]|nr:phosphatidylglycerophosphatase A [Bacillota bacterium]
MDRYTPSNATGRRGGLAWWVATGVGVGQIPIAPGTWASALALVLHTLASWLAARASGSASPAWSASPMPPVVQGVALVTVAMVGLWAARRVMTWFSQRDPSAIVIDEVSGQMIAWFGIAAGDWRGLVAGFVLFRVLDIWKPWLIRRTETLPGGWGIMADDWLAGAYAAAVLQLARVLGWL